MSPHLRAAPASSNPREQLFHGAVAQTCPQLTLPAMELSGVPGRVTASGLGPVPVTGAGALSLEGPHQDPIPLWADLGLRPPD